MFLLVYVSKWQHTAYAIALLGDYDNVNVSYKKPACEGDTWQNLCVARAYNAHLNNWDAFNGFAVAVILSLQYKLETILLAKLCNAFLFIRILYTIVYPLAHNAELSLLRSTIFTIGISITLRIFTLAIAKDFSVLKE